MNDSIGNNHINMYLLMTEMLQDESDYQKGQADTIRKSHPKNDTQ